MNRPLPTILLVLQAIVTLGVFPAVASDSDDTSKIVSQQADSAYRKAVIIPVHGMIDPGLKAFIARATTQAESTGVQAIVYEMDTFGGELESAFGISDIIANIDAGILTIAYVKTKAISAGALISLSCRKLAMKTNTTIGDCAPIMQGREGPKMLGEKFQSPLRAKFRSLAKQNGYPSLLAEAMVSDDMEIMRVRFDSTWEVLSGVQWSDLSQNRKALIKEKQTIVEKGKLLTMDAKEAVDLGFASALVRNRDEALKAFHILSTAQSMEQSWSERMVRLLRKISPLLMLIGLAGIGLEMKSPGLIWPAVVGILCLGLVFGGQYLVGLANHVELILFALGLVLILVEINFIPGFGAVGLSGILLILASLLLSLQSFTIPRPEFPWQMQTFEKNLLTVALVMLGSFAAFFIFGKWITASSGFQRLVLHESEQKADGYVSSPPNIDALTGAAGTTESVLRPSGTAILNGQRYDVVTDGEFLEAGAKVKVVSTDGNRIVVEKA